MDRAEAAALLAGYLETFRRRSYAELRALIGAGAQTTEAVGRSGARYQLEVNVVWDERPGGNIRVLGAIDGGGWRAFVPLPGDFIVAPDGSFVGE